MGSGGTGSVYKGVDLVSSRPVAIKIQSGLHSSQEQLERFEQECHNLAALNHPAVVQYVAHGASPDGSMYLVMEWLVGEDLSEHLRRGPLTVAESGEFLASAVRALAYIHQRGVMHLEVAVGISDGNQLQTEAFGTRAERC
jgi:serine/threonine protein kinase